MHLTLILVPSPPRRAAGRVRQLLPLRVPRVHEEPRALPHHRGPRRDQRHQVRTHPRLPAVQVPRDHRPPVRLMSRRLTDDDVRRASRGVPRPTALVPGAPWTQPADGLALPTESSSGTLLVGTLGAQSDRLLPTRGPLGARATARRVPAAGPGTGPSSPLLQLPQPHARRRVYAARCRAARHVVTGSPLIRLCVFI